MKWIKKVSTTPLSAIAQVIDSLSGSSATNAPSIKAVNEAIASLTAAIEAKQDAITLTANKAVVTDANGKLKASSVTATQLGYLSGVTSDIQTQITTLDAAVATKADVTSLSKSNNVTAANAGDVYSTTFKFQSTDGYVQNGDAGIFSAYSDTNSIRIDSVTKSALSGQTYVEYYVLFHGTQNGATGKITFNTLKIGGLNPYNANS